MKPPVPAPRTFRAETQRAITLTSVPRGTGPADEDMQMFGNPVSTLSTAANMHKSAGGRQADCVSVTVHDKWERGPAYRAAPTALSTGMKGEPGST